MSLVVASLAVSNCDSAADFDYDDDDELTSCMTTTIFPCQMVPSQKNNSKEQYRKKMIFAAHARSKTSMVGSHSMAYQ